MSDCSENDSCRARFSRKNWCVARTLLVSMGFGVPLEHERLVPKLLLGEAIYGGQVALVQPPDSQNWLCYFPDPASLAASENSLTNMGIYAKY